ncbi:MAG: Aldehyde ferredoxin oxidoreductase, partial [Pseudothermotoga lettingae]
INEKDFLERVKFYAEFIEQDKIMAKQFLSHTID